MRSKEERDEVFNHLRPYLEDEETVEDLIDICRICECHKYSNTRENPNNYKYCRECPIMELWLSNEYGEWCDIKN